MEIDKIGDEFVDRPDEVFLFDQSLFERLSSLKSILSSPDKTIPASEIKSHWRNYLEVAVEPTGWQAIWQIGRCHCDKLGLRFPTEVMGTVEQVIFEDQTAQFLIEAVQEDIQLPETYEVPLTELWPLRAQENSALNLEITAKALDQFRFFYNHIWMPWDQDDDEELDWTLKHLESRVKFHLALVTNKMSPTLVSYARHLLTEAQYIQSVKAQMEEEMADDDKAEVKSLMRLNFRLRNIANEMEAIENPVLRDYFEKIHFERDEGSSKRFPSSTPSSEILAVCPARSLAKMTKSLQAVAERVGEGTEVGVRSSLQEVLEVFGSASKVFLLPGLHSVRFSEYLFGKGEFVAAEGGATVDARYSENALFTVQGDFCFENLTFDCSNVRNGFLIKGGSVRFRKCLFSAGPKGDPGAIAVICHENGNASFEECEFRGFSGAVLAHAKSAVSLVSCKVEKCRVGVNAGVDAEVALEKVDFREMKEAGLVLEVEDGAGRVVKDPTNDQLASIPNLRMSSLDFGERKEGNIVVVYKNSEDLTLSGNENFEDMLED